MKRKIKKPICSKINRETPYKWKDIKNLELEDEDIVESFYEEPDGDSDGYFFLNVIREVEETDEEYRKRLACNENTKKFLKERRYHLYLSLKKEFENERTEIS